MSTPPRLSLPDGARRIGIEVARGSRAALEIAPPDAVGTAVLIPGFTGSKEDFIDLLVPLAERGWRVVAFDQLGQWESQGPNDPAAYALELLGADARDIAASVTGPTHLVGHSLGGLVARSAVIDAGADVASITLLCSGPGALPDHRRGAIPALVDVLPDMPMAQIWQVKEQMDQQSGEPLPPPDVRAFLRERFVATNPWGLRTMGEILLAEPDRTHLLAGTGVPAHVVYGVDDDVWPLEEQDAMAATLGGAAQVIAGAAHSPAVDDPQATAALLDALWRTNPSPSDGS